MDLPALYTTRSRSHIQELLVCSLYPIWRTTLQAKNYLLRHRSNVSTAFLQGSKTAENLQIIGQLEPINLKSGVLNFGSIDTTVGYNLLRIFWNRQHCTGSVVYRPAFVRDMACRGRYFNDLLLNVIMFVAAKYAAELSNDSCVSAMALRRTAEETLYRADTHLLTKSSVTTIQALLLMATTLFAWCDERSLSWQYMGIAINMIIDLGIHATNSAFYQRGSAEDREIGRRIFWAAYSVFRYLVSAVGTMLTRSTSDADKVQAIYQGRPVRLRAADCSVPALFLDDYEELESFNSLTFAFIPQQLDTPTRSISTTSELCRLSVIAESIVATLYTESSREKDAQTLVETYNVVAADLEKWRSSLPEHLDLRWHDMSKFDVVPHSLSLL